LDPFVEGVGLGAGATAVYALSPRWRLLIAGGFTWFDAATSLDPDWIVWEGRAAIGLDLLRPSSRADLLVTLGGGVVSFDPGEPEDVVPQGPAVGSVVPSVVAGVRLELPLAGPLGVAIAPRVVRTIPVEDNEPGPDSSWMWDLAVGLAVRP
ncbi:MAG: hypothetical protein ACRELC_10165, partial [Gemmatimonadota bacterium]